MLLNVPVGLQLINNGELKNEGSFNNDGFFENNGTFINIGGGTGTNTGLFNNHGTINNYTSLYNYGKLNNFGSIRNELGSNLISTEGDASYIFNDGGVITNLGLLTIDPYAKMYNANSGVVTNNGTYTIGTGADFFNADGTLTCGEGFLRGSSPITSTTNTCFYWNNQYDISRLNSILGELNLTDDKRKCVEKYIKDTYPKGYDSFVIGLNNDYQGEDDLQGQITQFIEDLRYTVCTMP